MPFSLDQSQENMAKNRSKFRNRAITLLLGFVIPALAGFAPDEPSVETALSDYQKGLKALEEKFSHCKGEGVYSTFRLPKNSNQRVETKAKIEFAYSPGKGRQAKSPIPWNQPETKPDPTKKADLALNFQTIIGYNDKYSFFVGRSTPTAAPVIEWLDPGQKGGRRQIDNSVGFLSLCPIAIYHVRLSDYFQRKAFHVDRVVELPTSSKSRRWKFVFSEPMPQGLKKNARPAVAGWFVVAPDDGWLLHEYGIVHANPITGEKIYTYVGHVAYEKNSHGEQIPTRAGSRLYWGAFDSDPVISNPSIVAREGEDLEFTSFQFTDSPSSDFTLSGFGLPEYGQTVAQVSAARSRPWWIFAIAGLSGVAAFVLRRLATRNRDAQTPEKV
jgi:hypothetical protein